MGTMGATDIMIYSHYQVLLPLKKEYIYSPSALLFYHPTTKKNDLPIDYILLSQDEADEVIEQNKKQAR